jgi:pimeloyl-ACP methyl ester carboxylesterase
MNEELIRPEFTEIDGLRIRYATSPKPSAQTVVLLSPWPESIYAYLPMWESLAGQFSLLALDLPGFGQSEGRPELMSTRTMAGFVARLLASFEIEAAHGIGPDIGTGALLWAAVEEPQAFRTITVGAGAATFPLKTEGLLKTFIEAGSTDPFRELDPAEVIAQSVGSIRNYDVPAIVRGDYLTSYGGDRFAQSVAYVQSYPADLQALAHHLPSLRTPVQILVGRDDPYGLAPDAEALDHQLPHSRLQVLACGHNAWEEEPVLYGEAIAEWVHGDHLRV